MTELEKIYELQERVMKMGKMTDEVKIFTLDLLKMFMNKYDAHSESSDKSCRDALFDIYDYIVTEK